MNDYPIRSPSLKSAMRPSSPSMTSSNSSTHTSKITTSHRCTAITTTFTCALDAPSKSHCLSTTRPSDYQTMIAAPPPRSLTPTHHH